MTARNLCLLGLLAAPLAAQLPDPPALPAAARSIEVVPSTDAKLKFHFLATGKQIYQCGNGALAIHHGPGRSGAVTDLQI